MINWFDMPAEGLSNGGQFEVKELEVTENGTYETKGEMYNKVTVNVEGGGGLELTPMYITGTFTEMECKNSHGNANTFYIRDFIVDPENVLTSPPLWIINLVPQTITLTGANNDTTTLTIPQADLMGNVQYGAWLEWNDTTNNYDLKFKTEDFLRVETTSLSISLAPITLYDGTSETKAILRFEP